jgi:hypothetical protein
MDSIVVGNMIKKLTSAIRALSRKISPSNKFPTHQTEFDFRESSTLPAIVRLNLATPHMEMLLDAISSAYGSGRNDLRIELIGPGILIHDHALMLFDTLKKRPHGMHVHVHSHTCLSDGAILLWLAGETRSIRRDAWLQLSPLPPIPTLVDAIAGYESAVQVEEEQPAASDLRTIMEHLEEWMPTHEIAGLRLFQPDLEELGLLETPDTRDQLQRIFNEEPKKLETERPNELSVARALTLSMSPPRGNKAPYGAGGE